ncbi:Aldo/keto reductase [Colletotrichum asianum]
MGQDTTILLTPTRVLNQNLPSRNGVQNGVKTFKNGDESVDLALQRMQQKRLALLEYTTWINNLCYLHTLQERGKIDHIGLTNTDAAHRELLLNTGFNIATNQVPCSVLNSRLTMLDGFLGEKWPNQPVPSNMDNPNWSLRKYLRLSKLTAAVLKALDRHQVPISAVATRHVLDNPSVKAVIVGSRLSPQRSLFEPDEEDRTWISIAQEGLSRLTDLPGDLGDEYRRPPYLTASGDLSERHASLKPSEWPSRMQSKYEYLTGSIWKPIALSPMRSR